MVYRSDLRVSFTLYEVCQKKRIFKFRGPGESDCQNLFFYYVGIRNPGVRYDFQVFPLLTLSVTVTKVTVFS